MTDKCCGTCELCMPINGELLCAGGTILPDGRKTYGMKIDETEKLFPNGCDDYSVSLGFYMDDEHDK